MECQSFQSSDLILDLSNHYVVTRFWRGISRRFKLHYTLVPEFVQGALIVWSSIRQDRNLVMESCLHPCWPSNQSGCTPPHCTVHVHCLYISCYLSVNKPVLSYLLSRLLPQSCGELSTPLLTVKPVGVYPTTLPAWRTECKLVKLGIKSNRMQT
jgi:hypothetical protein